ncbi:hypothetical protein KKH3_30110 [Pectobacterium actinidiae]|nr:hypothetical protein KKH3_30110 [Pectobacterium actinidiae]
MLCVVLTFYEKKRYDSAVVMRQTLDSMTDIIKNSEYSFQNFTHLE